jgi:hypothetical protein
MPVWRAGERWGKDPSALGSSVSVDEKWAVTDHRNASLPVTFRARCGDHAWRHTARAVRIARGSGECGP